MTRISELHRRIRTLVAGGIPVLAVARIATYGSFGLASLLIARTLKPEGYGVYSASVAVATIALVINSFGQDQLYLRNEIDRRTLEVRSVQSGAVSVIALLVLAALWPSLTSIGRLCSLTYGLAVILQRLLMPYLVEPLHRLEFDRRAKRELLVSATFPILGFAIGFALHRTAITFCVGSLAAAAALAIGRVPRPTWGEFRRNLPFADFKRGISFAFAGAFYVIYFQSDIAVLGAFGKSRSVGLYAAACSLMSAFILFSTLLTNDVMRSRLYKLEPGSAAFRDQALRSGIAIVGVGTACAAIAYTLAAPLMGLVFGHQFEAGASYFRILSLAILAYYLSNWGGNILFATGHIRYVWRTQMALAIVNVSVNIVLIPHFGATASGWITGLCEVLGFAIFTAIISRGGYLKLGRHPSP